MDHTTHDHAGDERQRTAMNRPAARDPGGRPLKTALLMVALVGGFYLLREHWAHVASNWIYLLLLACPLMHFFHGHGGHGSHGGSSHGAGAHSTRRDDTQER